MNVLKFGGTSMGDEHTWRRVLNIIGRYDSAVIVVSATARTTRQLVAASEAAVADPGKALEISKSIQERHKNLIRNFLKRTTHPKKQSIQKKCAQWIDECITVLQNLLLNTAEAGQLPPAKKDAIASIGEQLSAYLLAECGKACGLNTCWIDARNIIKTDSDFGQANPDFEEITQSVNLLWDKTKQGFFPVIGGFYGENKRGEVTTLGFEGSDYTASLVGAALGVQTIEIWTDVSGIFTCDPRTVKKARPIPQLSFREATELAYFGAKVLHPSTLKPAAAADIPVFVKNIFEEEHPGTKIHHHEAKNGIAKALAYLDNIAIVTVTSNETLAGHQFLAEAFRVLSVNHISVIAVTTTEATVSVALKADSNSEKLREQLKEIGTLSRVSNQGLISLIGCNPESAESITEKIFVAIPGLSPSLISYSQARQNFNIAVPETDLIPAVCRIHDLLFYDR